MGAITGREQVQQSTFLNDFLAAMARTYLLFGDTEGKLDLLRVECGRCPRKGGYSVRGLIEKYGRQADMMKWKEHLTATAPSGPRRNCMIAAT